MTSSPSHPSATAEAEPTPTSPIEAFPYPRALAFAVVLAAVLSWLVLARQVVTGSAVVQWDDQVAQWMHARAGPGVTELFLTLSALHTLPPLLLAAAAIGAALWRRGERVWWWLFPVALLGVACLNMALKEWLRRDRPGYSGLATQLHSFSFPSGHAAHASVFYGLLALLAWQCLRDRPRWRAVASAAALAMGLAVMAGRVVLGVHYVADVAAGLLVGVAWVALLLAILAPAAARPFGARLRC